MENPDYVLSLLAIVTELLLFCDCCVKYEVPKDIEIQICEAFIQSNIFETFLDVLKR